MKNIAFAFLILSLISFSGVAQTEKTQNYADVAVSFGGGFSGALSYNKLIGIGKSKKFKIGLGLRLTSFVGKNLDYITAPAKLTSGETGPQILFKDNVNANLDTLKLNNSQTNALNLSIHLQYSIKKIDIGFNIDAIGATFGGSQSGTFIAKSPKTTLNGSIQTAKPTAFNALLVSDNDLGSLNSELYGRYWLNDKLGIRAGFSFQFSEYTTDKKLTFDNDRFRAKTLMPFVALSIKL